MRIAAFRRPGHLFGTPFRLGEDEVAPPPAPEPPPPAPEPEPPPPPVKTCKPLGKPFVEDGACYRMFECTEGAVVTFEKRDSACPPPPPNVYPYPYLFPVNAYPPPAPTPTKIVIEEPPSSPITMKDAAPFAVGAAAIAGVLYVIFR